MYKLGCTVMILIGDFQFKKYPKISCSAGILPANNTRTGKIPFLSLANSPIFMPFNGLLISAVLY
jgi:hypothetical protein